ncbi:MAG: hypothetical protein HC806_04025 [Anaerolineae bacterium]|nr:hypothetical protein [Anaerolineae bacterium]
MPALIGIPILIFAVILQSAIFSQITLLLASADFVMVVVISWIINDRVKAVWEWALMGGIIVGFVSEVPMWGTVIGYLIITIVGIALKRRVWRAPLLALFTAIFLGTIIVQVITFLILLVLGTSIDPVQAFNLILLPSLLLNLLIALPVQGVMNEIASWFYREAYEA